MITPHERHQRLKRLRGLADRLDHNATLVRNGDNTAHGEKLAIEIGREAFAVRWAMLEIDPLSEGPMQILNEMAGE